LPDEPETVVLLVDVEEAELAGAAG